MQELMKENSVKTVSKFKTISCVAIVLFFLFSTRYSFIPLSVPTAYISILLMVLWGIRSFYILSASSIFFSFLFICVTSISYISNSDAADEYMLKISIIYFAMILFIPGFLNQFKFINFPKICGYVGLINACFILLMLVSPGFQNLYLKIIDVNAFELIGGESALDSMMRLRMIGINGLSVYTAGYVQSLCAIMYLYNLSFNKKIEIKNVLILSVIILSSVIAARSAIIGVLFIFILLSLFLTIKQLSKIILFGAVSLSAIFILIIFYLPDSSREFFINWISEFFISGSNTASFQANLKMFSFGLSDFSLIGDSRWFGGNNDYYMGSDVGWYRLAFSVGYLGGAIWVMLIISALGWSNLFTTRLRKVNIFAWCIFLYIIIMMFKGAVLFDSFQSVFFLLLLNFNSNKYLIGRDKEGQC